MSQKKVPVRIALLTFCTLLACNALSNVSTEQPTAASFPPTVTPDTSLTQPSETAQSPEQPTQMPICTPPACQAGETIVCLQAQGCPLGCGVVCGVPSPSATSAGPTETAFTPPDAPEANAEFEGISFHFDSSITREWKVEIVPALPVQGPEAFLIPSHYAFTFPTYPVANTHEPPRILVFPVKNFENYNSFAITEIAKLQKIITDQPTSFSESNPIPMLPIPNAGQLVHAKVAYINFQNGSGIRYITELAQMHTAIANSLTFYTFQGLTSDHQYLVAAYFPISHPALPPDDSNAAAIIGGDYAVYIAGVEAQLNQAANNEFTPGILSLDLMIQSLTVK